MSTLNCLGDSITYDETSDVSMNSDLPDTLAVPALFDVTSSPPEDPCSYYVNVFE